ncbi:MAG: LacI family DNA-binding transcriptional regulator [Spirochaetaceae bacterium]|nr:LacI family DNA-binding transcriptional regulator [Spirochaetaceae bacterium]
MATQKDVAKLANVSFITVSRVINNNGNVKEETRKRVEAAIKELNYYPNRMAQGLNQDHTNTLGIITSIPDDISAEANSYYRRLITGIEHRCLEQGYDVLLSTLRDSGAGLDVLKPYYERKAAGLILLGAHPSPQQKELIQQEKIPFIIVGDQSGDRVLSFIDTDNFQGMYTAVKYLIDQGHCDIAYIKVDRWTRNAQDRFRGFLTAMDGAGLTVNDKLIGLGDFSRKESGQILKDLWAHEKRPTAVVCTTDLMAFGVYEAARELGIRVPEDLSVIGFDGHEIGNYLSPPLATLVQPLEEMGYRAAEILIEAIDEKKMEPQQIIYPVNFEAKGSISKRSCC